MTEEENKTEKPAPAQMPNLGKFQNVEALCVPIRSWRRNSPVAVNA